MQSKPYQGVDLYVMFNKNKVFACVHLSEWSEKVAKGYFETGMNSKGNTPVLKTQSTLKFGIKFSNTDMTIISH